MWTVLIISEQAGNISQDFIFTILTGENRKRTLNFVIYADILAVYVYVVVDHD
jgi:hypothetical protein